MTKKHTPTNNSTYQKIRNGFSRLTLFLTLVFGAVTTLTLLEEPSRTLQPVISSVSGGRSIASIAGAATRAAVGRPYMSTLEVNCDVSVSQTTVSEHVRVRGLECAGGVSSAAVTNLSNGFNATVFWQAGKGFTTDYIALNPGVNSIVIERKLASGDVETQTVSVTRD